MNRLAAAWNRYWFAATPLIDLAMIRVIAVGTQLILLLFARNPAEQRLFAALPDDLYDPIPMLRVFIWPLGWNWRPPMDVLEIVWAIAVIAAILGLIGLRTNLSLLFLTSSSVFLQAHEWSYGDIHHAPAVMMVALGALTVSPCGRTLSLDALWRRRRAAGAEATSRFAGWPIRLLQWFFVTMYFSAATEKMFNTGFAWANGYDLQYFLIMDGLRWNHPLALWLSQFHWPILVTQWLVVLFQLSFAAAVVVPRLRWLYVPAGLAFHIGILLTLGAPFFEWMALYAIFIPWSVAFAYAARRLRPPVPVAVAVGGAPARTT